MYLRRRNNPKDLEEAVLRTKARSIFKKTGRLKDVYQKLQISATRARKFVEDLLHKVGCNEDMCNHDSFSLAVTELFEVPRTPIYALANRHKLVSNSLLNHLERFHPGLLQQNRTGSCNDQNNICTHHRWQPLFDVLVADLNQSIKSICERFDEHDASFKFHLKKEHPSISAKLSRAHLRKVGCEQTLCKHPIYSEAIMEYGETTESLEAISKRRGINIPSLSAHFQRYHSDMKHRQCSDGECISPKWSALIADFQKDTSVSYSSIAKKHGQNDTTFVRHIKRYHPSLVKDTEIKHCTQAVCQSHEKRPAVEDLLRDPSLEIVEVARNYDINYGALHSHIARYHNAIVDLRSQQKLGHCTTESCGHPQFNIYVNALLRTPASIASVVGDNKKLYSSVYRHIRAHHQKLIEGLSQHKIQMLRHRTARQNPMTGYCQCY